jgi:CheY-like chemotaxis protein
MLRVFLVIDDYNELIYLQTLLKKLGFDVEGLQNQKKYADLSLGFNPQILIATARGRKVDGLQLAQSIIKRRGIPKIIVLKNSDQSFGEGAFDQIGVDTVLESPINPKKLIHAIAELGGVDENPLLEKYSKMKGTLTNSGVTAEAPESYDDNGQPIESVAKVKGAINEISQPDIVKVKGGKGFQINNDSEISAIGTVGAKFPLENKKSIRATEGNTVERKDRFEKWQREMGALPAKKFDRERIKEFNKKIRETEPPEDIEEIEDERRKFVKALFKDK